MPRDHIVLVPTLAEDREFFFSIPSILHTRFNYSSDQIKRFMHIYENTNLTLDAFLAGTEFGSREHYSAEEKNVIVADMHRIIEWQFANVMPADRPLYTATAGAPGVGKSYFIEKLYGGYKPANAVYIDPDRVALLQMSLYNRDKLIIGSEAAYTKWRNASNFIANFMLIKAMAENLNIIHGTTSQSPRVLQIYDFLKAHNYLINIHLLFADASSRELALTHRAGGGLVQVTVTDAKGKARPVFDRLCDAYHNADRLFVYVQPERFWFSDGRASPALVAKKGLDMEELIVLPGSDASITKLHGIIDEEIVDAADLNSLIKSKFQIVAPPAAAGVKTTHATAKDDELKILRASI